MRRHDQHVDAFGQHVVGLLGLHGVVAVGDLHVERGADFLRALLDELLVALPALFLERVHGESDAHRPRSRRSRCAGGLVFLGLIDAGGGEQCDEQDFAHSLTLVYPAR